MNENMVNLSEFNMSDEELFAPVDHDKQASERITAPRYSYWRSVFRVFFRKKINIVALVLLAVLVAFSYVYPAVIGYDAEVDPYVNLRDDTTKHLKPTEAIERFGFNLKWVLGSGASGNSTFDAIWYGSSISISLALVCAAINMFVGVAIGAVWKRTVYPADLRYSSDHVRQLLVDGLCVDRYRMDSHSLLHPYPGHHHTRP